MYEIMKKLTLNSFVKLMEINAPYIARKAEPGQFIMMRVSENGERIPLTIADYNRTKGTITLVFQEVGKSTRLLGALNEGDRILDLAGPLGTETHLMGYKKAIVIGGGLGTAIAYPQAKELNALGTKVHSILGFRNKDMIIFENEMEKVSSKLYITTDDGSNGKKGFVTDILERLIHDEQGIDLVIAIGPLLMMRAVANLTRDFGIKTIVSMNPIMIDGTGMCGGCRVTVAGKTCFACVDGPDFDGHDVDFEEALRRQSMYMQDERICDDIHCRLIGAGGN
jgi:ferredoxin/flavodoxin---NADP+ reductase